MDLPTIIGCVAILAAGVGIIAYVLLHGPKNAVTPGVRPEISLGEETPDGDADAAADATPESKTADEEEA